MELKNNVVNPLGLWLIQELSKTEFDLPTSRIRQGEDQSYIGLLRPTFSGNIMFAPAPVITSGGV